MLGLSSRSKHSSIAIVDVGSASAAVAILKLQNTGPAVIEATTRLSLSFEDRTPQQSVAALAQAVREAGDKTLTFYRSLKEHPSPQGLYIFLRIPWCRSKSTESKQKFQDESSITDKVVSQLAKKVLSEEKDIDTKNLLEAAVIKILLNGYQVSDPKGKRAHEVSISVLLSDADLKAKTAILEAVKSLFPSHVPQWRTHTRAVLRVLGESTDDWRNSLVIDVGTEGTSLSVIRKGTLQNQETLPYGSRAILKTISKKGMPEETMALLSLFDRDQAGDSTEQIRTQIAEAEPELVKIFGERFSSVAAQRRLPNTLLLVVHPELAPILSRFFSKIDFAQFTITNQPFSVISVDAKRLENIVTPSNGVQPDPSISIAAAFVNMEEKDPS